MLNNTGPNHDFFLENRKKVVRYSISLALKLKDNESAYIAFCKELMTINDCSVSTDNFIKYIKTQKSTLLSSDDWIGLERIILHEHKCSKRRERDEAINRLIVMRLQRFVAILVSCLAPGIIIALAVAMDPLYILLLLPTFLLSTASLTALIQDTKKEYSSLLDKIQKDNFESDYTDGLAFAPNDLAAMLSTCEQTTQSISSPNGLFSHGYVIANAIAVPSAPPMPVEVELDAYAITGIKAL